MTLTRDEIRERLRKLAESKAPIIENPVMFAMCYAVAGISFRFEYNCPECGAKTVYYRDEPTLPGEYPLLKESALDEVDQCRDMIESIGCPNLRLDEKEFCRTCCPEIGVPALALIVTYDNDHEIHRVRPITAKQLQLVADFLKGEAIHEEIQDAQTIATPTKDHAVELGRLLGVSLETPDK